MNKPQEGFVRRLFFDACDKAVRRGDNESSFLVHDLRGERHLSKEEMESVVRYAKKYGFIK